MREGRNLQDEGKNEARNETYEHSKTEDLCIVLVSIGLCGVDLADDSHLEGLALKHLVATL